MEISHGSISQAVHDYLVKNHGESHNKRHRGVFFSQSFKKIFEYVDPDDVIQIVGRRQIKNKSESFPSLLAGGVGSYTRCEEQIKVAYTLDYNRQDHGPFDSDGVMDDIGRKDLTDLPIERLVIRFNNDRLYNELRALFEDLFGFVTSDFQQPFYCVMKSRAVKTKRRRERLKEVHPEWYFHKDDSGEHETLNWKHRTLDLVELWSHYAWVDAQEPVITHKDPDTGEKVHLAQRELEDLAFNHVGTDEPVFGVVNSTLAIGCWQSMFNSHMVDRKGWRWEEDQQGWVKAE